MRTLKHPNQYRYGYKWLDQKTQKRVYMALCAMMLFAFLGSVGERNFRQNIISPLPDSIATKPIKVYAVETNVTQKEIDAYIKHIFGKDAKIALAVNRGECNPANKKYPHCLNVSEIEHSVGLFQINLITPGTGKKVHWDKVPGKTLEEKEHFLQDPMNNVLIAYKIFKDSGWQAWSAYTNGSYKAHL